MSPHNKMNIKKHSNQEKLSPSPQPMPESKEVKKESKDEVKDVKKEDKPSKEVK